MPEIIPIRDLKNTNEISQKCHASDEPIFVTKNGYGDMVVMSMATYERVLLLNEVYSKLAQAEQQIAEGKLRSAEDSLHSIREQYGL